MAILKHQEVSNSVRDHRSVDRKITDALTNTKVTIVAIGLMAFFMWLSPWLIHILGPLTIMWWSSVAFNVKRQVLPYYLPRRAGRTDFNSPKEGSQQGFKPAEGIIYLGAADDRYAEVWESSSASRQHHLVFGTTGAGKSEALSGLFANFILLGAGCIFSDAKGTAEQISKLSRLARRFGRDVDYFNLYYGTGGQTVRDGARKRLSNRANPCAHASADQLNNMFLSFLPSDSGSNQIFQDQAISMFTAITPTLVDLRDLGGEPLNIPKIGRSIGSLQSVLELYARGSEDIVTEKSRAQLGAYLRSLPGFDPDVHIAAPAAGKAAPKIEEEVYRMFAYARNYFGRALSSLTNTYGHIYDFEAGEIDYVDAVLNRRIVVISLPALEKAGAELRNLAKINLSNIRGAIAIAAGNAVEGDRSVVLDNLPSSSSTPTGLILDEYGYQATEGFAITMAQARSLGFSITIAGQDFSNIKIQGTGDESDAIFGNAVLICLPIRNTKELGDRIKDMVGEADIAVEGGLDKKTGMVSGYMQKLDVSIQRRFRVTSSDLLELNTGQAWMFVGRNIGNIKFYPWSPLPEKADSFTVNRFLPASLDRWDVAPEISFSNGLDKLIKARIEGNNLSTVGADSLPPTAKRVMRDARSRLNKGQCVSEDKEAESIFYGAMMLQSALLQSRAAGVKAQQLRAELGPRALSQSPPGRPELSVPPGRFQERAVSAAAGAAPQVRAPRPQVSEPPPDPAPSKPAAQYEMPQLLTDEGPDLPEPQEVAGEPGPPVPATSSYVASSPVERHEPASQPPIRVPPSAGSFGFGGSDDISDNAHWSDLPGSLGVPSKWQAASSMERRLAAQTSLDSESDEDHNGDVNDVGAMSRVTNTHAQAAVALQTMSGGSADQQTARAYANAQPHARDFAGGLTAGAAYKVPVEAPTEPLPGDTLMTAVHRLKARQRRVPPGNSDQRDKAGTETA